MKSAVSSTRASLDLMPDVEGRTRALFGSETGAHETAGMGNGQFVSSVMMVHKYSKPLTVDIQITNAGAGNLRYQVLTIMRRRPSFGGLAMPLTLRSVPFLSQDMEDSPQTKVRWGLFTRTATLAPVTGLDVIAV